MCGIVGLRALTRGVIDHEALAAAVRDADVHHPRTSLVVLENTHNFGGGRVVPLEVFRAVRALADRHGLSVYLDGARLCNAAVASGVPLAAYLAEVDLASTCLSKGLGCPAGSMVIGDDADIAEARRLRKVLGGGMRQVGVLAAPALVALEEGFDEGGDQLFTFPDAAHVEEVRNGFRVDRNRGASHEDQRVTVVAVCGAQGQACEVEHGEQIRVVVLEGGRECD